MSDNRESTPYPSFKISYSSVVESDRVLFSRECAKFFKIISALISGDFILSEYVFIHDFIIKPSIDNEEINWELFAITTSVSFGFFGIILFLFYLKKLLLTKITRFIYLIIGIIYFLFQVSLKMYHLSEKDFDLDIYDIILFIVLALSIIPRITGFLYIRVFEKTIKKINDAKIAEEHEMFIEKVSGNMDRSTVGNRVLDKEIEKELEKDEEEVIFKVTNEKILGNTNENNKNQNKKKDKDENKEEIADMD